MVEMKKIIYADNAATTKLDIEAFEAMKPYLLNEYGNASQPYSFARSPKRALSDARETIANTINALPEEIFFTSGGTESDNWAIKGCISSNIKKTSIITSEIEHHAVLKSCQAMEKTGVKVTLLPVDKTGVVQPKTLKEMITDKTKLVSVMYSNNEIGTIEPIKELAQISHEYGSLFHTDAVQAIGHVAIDVKNIDVDFLSASAHKFNGPKGIGFLYSKKGSKLMPIINGGSQERGLRAGTENIALIVGMSVALKNNQMQMANNKKHIQQLEDVLLNSLSDIEYIRNGSENHIPGNISLSFKGCDGEAILHRLDLKGICISTGSACDGNDARISHVINAIRVPEEYAKGTIRISLGKENTYSEVKKLANALINILKG